MKKIFCLLLYFFLLVSCAQSTVMLGPAITVYSSGNVYQAGLSYGANESIKKATGKTATEYVMSYKDLKKKEIERTKKLQDLIEEHIKVTKKKLDLKNIQ